MKLSKLVSILGNSKDEYVLHICNCNKTEFARRIYSKSTNIVRDPDYRYWRKYKVYCFNDNNIYVWHPKIHIQRNSCFTVNDIDTRINDEN